MTLRDGRYGPYVNHGKVNATIPRGTEPDSVTLEQALALLAERAGKAPTKTARRKPAAKKADGEKKAPDKKPAAKKTTKKKAAAPGE